MIAKKEDLEKNSFILSILVYLESAMKQGSQMELLRCKYEIIISDIHDLYSKFSSKMVYARGAI